MSTTMIILIVCVIVLILLGVLLIAAVIGGRSKPRESQMTAFSQHSDTAPHDM